MCGIPKFALRQPNLRHSETLLYLQLAAGRDWQWRVTGVFMLLSAMFMVSVCRKIKNLNTSENDHSQVLQYIS
jgi:uncharacterized membrane protein YciS (DUF1049 family)